MTENLLGDPGFDGEFRAVGGKASVMVAMSWLPFFIPHVAGEPEWKNRQPEWKPAAQYPSRIHSGVNAQQWFNFYGTNECAGVYQVVQVQEGKQFAARAWVQMWSASDDEPRSGGPQGTGNLRMRLGIDRAGGTDPRSQDIVWSDEVTQYDAWVLVEVEATAVADRITLFVASSSEFAVKHNDCYVDDVALWLVGADDDPPAPTDGVLADLRKIEELLDEATARTQRIAEALAQADRIADDLAAML